MASGRPQLLPGSSLNAPYSLPPASWRRWWCRGCCRAQEPGGAPRGCGRGQGPGSSPPMRTRSGPLSARVPLACSTGPLCPRGHPLRRKETSGLRQGVAKGWGLWTHCLDRSPKPRRGPPARPPSPDHRSGAEGRASKPLQTCPLQGRVLYPRAQGHLPLGQWAPSSLEDLAEEAGLGQETAVGARLRVTGGAGTPQGGVLGHSPHPTPGWARSWAASGPRLPQGQGASGQSC